MNKLYQVLMHGHKINYVCNLNLYKLKFKFIVFNKKKHKYYTHESFKSVSVDFCKIFSYYFIHLYQYFIYEHIIIRRFL